jgi:HK97 family phage prohead protease
VSEHRRIRGVEVRADEIDGAPGVVLQTIRPGVVDDYGSLWNADVFDDSLGERLPVLCWAHDWSEPLGPGVDYEASDEGPRVRFRFSDFDAVPQARRAHAQVTDGTIRDCSVGFSNVTRRNPTEEETRSYPGVREVIERASLDEVSLVLRGAVPGAKVLAVRTKEGRMAAVDENVVVDLARKVSSGELTKEQAKAALDLVAGPDPEPETTVDAAAIDADAAAAFDEVFGG